MLENAQEWLDLLEITPDTQYYQVILYCKGLSREGFGKISEDKKSMTLLFHDNKDKWSISKESISPTMFYKAKSAPKSVFDTIVNQNLSNL